MHVEDKCGALLRAILPHIDPQKTGLCIDVGVGTGYHHFEIFSTLGFPTIAVEPLPTELVVQKCAKLDVRLFEACLSDISGKREIFVGAESSDYSSLFANWWGASAQSRMVASLTLGDLLAEAGSPPVTCLKVDVEGAEALVLGQLPGLAPECLPSAVMFEFGGGEPKSEGAGGWTEEFAQATVDCLAVLEATGYRQAIIVDGGRAVAESSVDLHLARDDFASLFPDNSLWGNIIALRGFEIPVAFLTTLFTQFRSI